jgi:hypothetical protein
MVDANDVVIVSAVRTPFGRFGGSLRDIDYYELGAIPMREVLKRVNVSPDTVNEVFWGVGDTSACRDPIPPWPADSLSSGQVSPMRHRQSPLIWLVYQPCMPSSWRP